MSKVRAIELEVGMELECGGIIAFVGNCVDGCVDITVFDCEEDEHFPMNVLVTETFEIV